ncbi:dienelactone hydrolase [Cytobacillus eiseniae]|uniref:Dienelactone hydrolase n=1 Tax=Cytobacillus eiseniae TaxID=762947 RepID=A0ABS4RHB2_9BACI|nr:alpha/beta hydrolase [Cytobacillus eiseniae]MBP2242268.1 dienelactone hydrolase [Cytobacillus eiseniae]
MAKKTIKSIRSLMLASTLGLTAVAGNLAISGHQVSAEEVQNVIDYENRSKEFLNVVQAKNWDDAYHLLSKDLQSALPKELLSTLWSQLTAPYGEVKETSFERVKNDGVHTKATFIATAEQGVYKQEIKFNKEGQIDDFLFDVITAPESFLNPPYNHPENYNEKQVVIGEGKYALPGVLTVPKGDGPFPVVVLVHGSGPNDMDETMNVFKPFRDIAVGLANEGIAVLRYDKRTRAHTVKTSTEPTFSIQEETVIDANLAVDQLKTLPEIDPNQIFVLGHSQGAFALPLIVENDKSKDIKGVIGVAGPAGKFHKLLVWQMEEQLKLAEKMKAPKEQIIAINELLATYQNQFSILEDPQYSKENIPASFQMQNAYWWFDLRDYVPTELAKKQDIPTLLLQGAKDLQVPVSEFETWKTALNNRDNVDYKLYPNMFHTLVDYPGEPNWMTEYMTPGNVSQPFLSDIAEWVKTGSIQPAEVQPEPEDPKQEPTVYWDGLLMKKGQIGKIEVVKPINLWKRVDDKLEFVRVLQPGEHYRVYKYDNQFGGQYGLGDNHYITKMEEHIIYKTPSKAKLREMGMEN